MLFDKEFEFSGKHATYVRFLKNDLQLFKSFREAYTVAAIIGYINSSKSSKDKSEQVPAASILPSELAQKRTILTFLYRLIMLTDDKEGYEITDYQDRAFRDDANIEENPEKFAENMAIFNSYVLGGIEILYDKFKDSKSLKETVNILNDFLLEFAEDNSLMSFE